MWFERQFESFGDLKFPGFDEVKMRTFGSICLVDIGNVDSRKFDCAEKLIDKLACPR